MISWGWNFGWKLRMHWYSLKYLFTFGISFNDNDFLKHSLWIRKYLPLDFEKRLEMVPKFCFLFSITFQKKPNFKKGNFQTVKKKITRSANWTKNKAWKIHGHLIDSFHPHDIIAGVIIWKTYVRIWKFAVA